MYVFVKFQHEPVHDLQTPREVIQRFIFEDLGGPSGTAGLKIIPLPLMGTTGKLQNQLFISQGRVRVSPTDRLLEEISEELGKEVRSFQVSVLAKHYFGGAAQPTVEAYCDGNLVDMDVGAKQQGKPEKLVVMDPEICYIEIEGTEVAIERICFVF